VFSLFGLRGTRFTSPPLDVFPEWAFPGMKYQPKLRPQAPSAFFADGRADRMPPPHTVMRGDRDDNDPFYHGKDTNGQWVTTMPERGEDGKPLVVDVQFIEHGRERYTIYCSPCHGLVGDGNGMTKKYGMGTTPSYHDELRRKLTDGEIFDTITHGSKSKVMFPYADKLTPRDRWAIVSYVRALQRAQEGTAADVTDPAARQTLGLK
jgi:mono/diheme cytochrome c family protein